MDGYLWMLALLFITAPFVGLVVSLVGRQQLNTLERRVRALEAAADLRDFARRDVPAPPAPAQTTPEVAAPVSVAPAVFAAPPGPSVFAVPAPPPPPEPPARAAVDDFGWRGLEGRLGGTW